MRDTGHTSSGLESKGFFSKLINGDFSLARTYWLYGVVVGIVSPAEGSPGSPVERTVEYKAPFFKPDREEDYRVAWEVFVN